MTTQAGAARALMATELDALDAALADDGPVPDIQSTPATQDATKEPEGTAAPGDDAAAAASNAAPTVAELQERIKELQAQVEREAQGRKSAEGRLRSGSNKELEEIKAEVRRLRQFMDLSTDPDLSPDERRQRIAQSDSEAAAQEQMKQFIARADGWAEKLNARIGRAGLEFSDDRLSEARELWSRGMREQNPNLLLDAVDVVDGVIEPILMDKGSATAQQAAAAAREEERKRRIQEGDLDLDGGSAGDGGAGSSDQAWLDRYSDPESDIPATAANTKRANDLWAKGLRPRPVNQ